MTAEAFDRKEFGGRNKAILLVCKTEDGAPLACVTKLKGRLERTDSIFWVEWVAGLIADELGVFVPPRYVVDVSQNFGRVLEKRLGGSVASYVGPAFGVEYVPNTMVVRDEVGALEQHLRDQAAQLMAFDAFIDNTDRKKDNPNCLLEANVAFGSRLVAIDHDCAFSGLYLHVFGRGGPALGWPDDIMEKHVFRGRFGNNKPGLDDIRTKIAGLSDAFLDELPRKVPPLWLDPSSAARLQLVIAKLKEHRDTIDTWFPKVERWVEA